MEQSPENYRATMTHRSELVLGPGAMERLFRVRVIIFGVGGVGSWCAEALVRTGVQNITIVDSDIICPTNINRQIQATSANTGKSKVEELKNRLLEINPGLKISAIHLSYDESSYKKFDIASYDYVIDAIDSLKNKLHLIEESISNNTVIFSSMGAGAKTDPSRIKADLLTNTHTCPLARRVRTGLRKRNVSTDFMCVYSDEQPIDPYGETLCGTGKCACVHDRDMFNDENDDEAVDWCGKKKRVNGSLVHITGIFGFTLAGLVIRDVIRPADR